MKRKFKKSPNIYLALFACMLAVGIGTVAALRENSVSTIDDEEFSRITIEWSVEETSIPLTDEVNIGISGIADERIFTTEASTAPIEKNKPFSGNFALPMGTDIM